MLNKSRLLNQIFQYPIYDNENENQLCFYA